MNAQWQRLMELGVPDGAVRPSPLVPLDGSTRKILEEVLAGDLAPREREILLAWLRAWRHHWPESFDSILGTTGESALEALADAVTDRNRYLKLRRIAIANLARRL